MLTHKEIQVLRDLKICMKNPSDEFIKKIQEILDYYNVENNKDNLLQILRCVL